MIRCETCRRYRPLSGWIAVAAMTALAMTMSSQALSADAATPTQVTIEKFKFIPPEVTVPVGATVVWINRDDEPHLVAAQQKQFKSKPLGKDDTFSVTFDKPGEYPYFCLIHPHMTGVVIVGEPNR
jgi:plastocyanin